MCKFSLRLWLTRGYLFQQLGLGLPWGQWVRGIEKRLLWPVRPLVGRCVSHPVKPFPHHHQRPCGRARGSGVALPLSLS